ncbi:MAG: gamma-glutamyltransferase [Eubacteriales bacterium]|nr:gamma-glutamyltransferase [Eubacteriales bacterium]
MNIKRCLALLLILSFLLLPVGCKHDEEDFDLDDDHLETDVDDGEFEGEDDIRNYEGLEISSPDELSQGVGKSPEVVPEGDNSHLIATQGFSISTSSVLASQAAASILEAGGNAFDAAICASFVLSVVEPYASGIGGSGAMLFYTAADDKYNFLDYRSSSGLAPKQIDDLGIPGLVYGMNSIHQLYAKLSWEQLLEPAIKLARDGFIVNSDIERAMRIATQALMQNPAFARDGKLVKSGELLIQEELAETLTTLAKEGADSFYTGSIAEQIEAKTNLTKDDLANYQSYYRRPIRITFNGQKFISVPPPYSGITTLQMMKMADILKIGEKDVSSPEFMADIERISLVAYDRQKMIVGDPQHIKFNSKKLLSKKYLRKYLERDLWENEQTDSTEQCTTHVSITDAEGNVVSLTNTLTSFWGSGIEVGGFYINNSLSNFSRNKRNYYRPLTRPRSFIAPLIIASPNGAKMAMGTPGGKLIPKLLFPILIDYYVHGTKLEEAINKQRFFFKAKSAITLEEDQDILPTWDIQLADYYVTRYGFHDYFGSVAVAGYHADGEPFAISDFRRQGLAIAKSSGSTTVKEQD